MQQMILLTLLFAQRHDDTAQIKKELANQHFSGVLQGDVRLTALGQLSCGSGKLRVVFYEWAESAAPGLATHASSRIILLRGKTYLGSYVVADKPKIQGDELRFPYRKNGSLIKCGDDGAPPKEVLLDGENVSLQK